MNLNGETISLLDNKFVCIVTMLKWGLGLIFKIIA